MPERAMQAEDPRVLPPLVEPSAHPGRRPADPGEGPGALRQVAGAVSALAARVGRLDERVSAGLCPRVSTEDRRKALDQAREFVTGLGTMQGADRVHAEVAVARYLTGE